MDYSNYFTKFLTFEEVVQDEVPYNNFDSLSFLLPLSQVTLDQEDYYPCDERQQRYKLKGEYLTVGLNGVDVDLAKKTVVVSVSSKILGADCLKLINKHTLPDVWRYLCGIGAFSFTYTAFKEATVLRVDVTKQVYCTQINSLIKALTTYGSSNYRVNKPHRNKAGSLTSVEFHKQRTKSENKVRLSVYDKEDELKKDKTFCSALDPKDLGKLQSQAVNLVRVEANFKNFAAMKKHLKVERNTVGNVVNSEVNVLKNILNEITSGSLSTIFDGVDSLDPLTLSARELPIYLALESKNWDTEPIRCMLKVIDSKNASRAIKPYEAMAARRNASESNSLVGGLLEYL